MRRSQGFSVGACRTAVTEKSSFATAPDILTPAQWYAGVHGDEPRFHGVKQLMLAVLVDALRCLQTCASARTVTHRRRLAEAEAWIADRNAQGPFTFETVCEALGIDANYLRTGVRKWVQQRLTGKHSHRQVRHEPNGRLGTISSPVRRQRHRAKEAAPG